MICQYEKLTENDDEDEEKKNDESIFRVCPGSSPAKKELLQTCTGFVIARFSFVIIVIIIIVIIIIIIVIVIIIIRYYLDIVSCKIWRTKLENGMSYSYRHHHHHYLVDIIKIYFHVKFGGHNLKID